MGISLVCGLGPGVPEHLDGSCRYRVRQASAFADHAGMVYETRWTDPGLRMEFQRCQSAGAGLGSADGLSDREGADGEGGSRLSQADLSKVAHQFYVVDQPKGWQWEQYVRRRISGS